MKRSHRLYNVLFPIWLLWIFPQVWAIILPGNLIIDVLVLLLALAALGCPAKKAVLRRTWWRVWRNGFLADAAGVVVQTTRRADTWIVQTPQCFHREALLEGHRLAAGDPEITDDCMLLERMGRPVKLVEGDYTNIKVTTAEDRILAELFLGQA